MFKELFFAPLVLLQKVIAFTLKQTELSIQEIYYYFGYIVGFIVETAISILFTGGTLTANKVLAKTFKEPVELLLKGLKNTVKASKTLINKIINAVKAILEALKNPTQLFKDFRKFLDELFGFGKKGIDDIEDALKLEKLRKTKKYWNNYKFKDLFDTPPKLPCFLAGTQIHTTKGLKPIESITISDTVLCYNQITKKLTQQQVRQVFTNFTQKYAVITTETGEILQVTGQHLFYQQNSDTWIKAYQLKIGMHLYNPITNTTEKIIAKKVIEKQVTTYNFEVPTHHNYIVGKTGILVHNANKRPSYKDPTKRGYAFYELTIENNNKLEVLYVGKTTREDIKIREAEHVYEGERNFSKGIKKHTWWKYQENIGSYHLNNKLEHRFVQMNEFESAIWERYHMEKMRADGIKLKNRQFPLGRKINSKTFDNYKRYWNNLDKDFNPCKYF